MIRIKHFYFFKRATSFASTNEIHVASKYLKKQPKILENFRKFWHINESLVVHFNFFAYAAIYNSRSLHLIFSFSTTDLTKLMVRQLYFFCPTCIDEDYDNSKSKEHVRLYRCVKLKPLDTLYIREQMVHHGDEEEWEVDRKKEGKLDLLNTKNNFFVLAKKDNGVEFYI